MRPYQAECIESVERAFSSGKTRVMIVMATGLGKTIVFSELIHRWRRAGRISSSRPAVVIAHREELLQQAADKIFNSAGGWIPIGIERASERAPITSEVIVASVQTVGRPNNGRLDGVVPGLIIIDECFPAGTLVDGRPIEEIRVGDYVRSWNERTQRVESRKVLHVFRSPLKGRLVRINVAGRTVVSTEGHPYYVRGRGWVPAAAVMSGDVVQCIKEDVDATGYMQGLSVGIHREGRQGWQGKAAERQEILLSGMQAGMDIEAKLRSYGRDKSETCIRSNEGKKPNAQKRNQRSHESNSSIYALEADCSGWKWHWSNNSTENSGIKTWMGYGTSNSDKDAEKQRLPYMLQGRRLQSCIENSRGSGREFALSDITTGAGQEERCAVVWAGVDSIEVLEPSGDDGFGGMCPEGVVYNLEVEETHTYYANGVLVHNCHHVAAASYQHALQKLGAFDREDVYTLGVTATPYRLDNRSIAGKNGTFEAEVYRSDILSGIDNGYLCDLRLYSVQTGTDLTGVRKRGDDFVESDLAKVLNNNKGRTLEAIKAWQEYAADRRTIVFCPSVEHAMDTAELWKGQTGVPSACIHGGTDPAIRRDVMTMFRRGRIQVLCNVDIATEGFDVPEIGCIVMLKPTLSWTKYIQMIGRGTRTAAGKQDCIVLDMVDLAAEHSICTIPAMVGLPASIDLKGTSMRQAASRAESVTEEVADALKAIAKGRKELPTLDDIEIAIQEINLRKTAAGTMKKVRASAYSWTKMADGSFVISTQVGVAKIKFDAVGNGRLIISDARKNVTSSDLTPGVDAHKAVIEAEKIVLNAFGKKALEYKKRNAPWKRSTDKPSEAQLNLLLRLGVRRESLSGLNKATASQMIDKIMAERAVRKAGI